MHFQSMRSQSDVCLCQVEQFLAGDSNRAKYLGETEFWSIADLQQLAEGPAKQTKQCIHDVVEDALSLATSLTAASDAPRLAG